MLANDFASRLAPPTSAPSSSACAISPYDSLVIDGFTHLICFAAGHEIIRQRKRDLTLVGLSGEVVVIRAGQPVDG